MADVDVKLPAEGLAGKKVMVDCCLECKRELEKKLAESGISTDNIKIKSCPEMKTLTATTTDGKDACKAIEEIVKKGDNPILKVVAPKQDADGKCLDNDKIIESLKELQKKIEETKAKFAAQESSENPQVGQ